MSETKKVLNMTRKRHYCVPRLLQPFGFDVENVVFTRKHFKNFVADNNVSVLLSSTYRAEFFPAGATGGDKIIHISLNENCDHALAAQIIYGNNYFEVIAEHDPLPENLAVAGKSRRNRKVKQELAKEVQQLKPLVEKEKQLVKKEEKKIDRDLYSSIKPRVRLAKILKQPERVFAARRAIRQNITSPGRGPGAVREFCAFAASPATANAQILYPDGLNETLIGTQHNWSNHTLPYVKYDYSGQSWFFNSVIHSAKSICEYLEVTKGTIVGTPQFTLANFKEHNSKLEDLDAPTNGDRSIPLEINGGEVIIPMHSAASSSALGTETSFSSPSEAVDLTSGKNVSFGTGAYHSFGLNTAMPFHPNDGFAILLTGSTISSGTLTVRASVLLTDGSVVNVVLGTATLAGGTLYYPLNTAIVVSNSLGLVGFQFSTDADITLKTVSVLYDASASNVATVSGPVILPWGRYIGSSTQTYPALTTLAERERCTAASMLVSCTSNFLQTNGSIMSIQITDGRPPAEAGIAGLYGMQQSQKALMTPMSKGFYSAPFKLASVESRTMRDMDSNWVGIQAYSLFYSQIQGATTDALVPTLQLVTHEFFEIVFDKDQQLKSVFPPATASRVVDRINTVFASNPVHTENPLHFDFIKKFIDIASKVAPVVSAAARASGNAYAIGAANVIDSFN